MADRPISTDMEWAVPDEHHYEAVLDQSHPALTEEERAVYARDVHEPFDRLMSRWLPLNRAVAEGRTPPGLARFSQTYAKLTPDLTKPDQAQRYGHLMDALGAGLDPYAIDGAAAQALARRTASGDLPEWHRGLYAIAADAKLGKAENGFWDDAERAAGHDGSHYPKVGTHADGLEVGTKIHNQSSIGASLDNYTRLGVREIPTGHFNVERPKFWGPQGPGQSKEHSDIDELVDQIQRSGRIDPLIVVTDKKGPYILEGAHRIHALAKLGKKSFPALVVRDDDSFDEDDEDVQKAEVPEPQEFHGRLAASLTGNGSLPAYSEDRVDELDDGLRGHPAHRHVVATYPDYFAGREDEALLPALWLHVLAGPHHYRRSNGEPAHDHDGAEAHAGIAHLLAQEGFNPLAKAEHPMPVQARALRALEAVRLHYGVPRALMAFHQAVALALCGAQGGLLKVEEMLVTLAKQAAEFDEDDEYDDSNYSKGVVHFLNRPVRPGRAQTAYGDYELLHDRGDAYVGRQVGSYMAEMANIEPEYVRGLRPPTGKDKSRLVVLPKSKEGTHFRVLQKPQSLEDGVLDAEIHGVAHLNTSPEQRALVHGADVTTWRVDPLPSAEAGSVGGRWVQSGTGSLAFLKARWGINMPDWEVQFYNVARDRFGLGSYVPTTAAFDDPFTGERHSLQEAVPEAAHHATGSGMQRAVLKRLGDAGELDKLAVMEGVMGSWDRHRGNYLFTPDGIKLIDNSGIYQPDHEPPHYWVDHHRREGLVQPLHPAAAEWAAKLDGPGLQEDLLRYGARKRDAAERAVKVGRVQELLRQTGGKATRAQVYAATLGGAGGWEKGAAKPAFKSEALEKAQRRKKEPTYNPGAAAHSMVRPWALWPTEDPTLRIEGENQLGIKRDKVDGIKRLIAAGKPLPPPTRRRSRW